MPPKMEQLTANDVMEIFEFALGEPPSIPPGCSALLLGLRNLFNKLTEYGIQPEHGALYAKVMRFLTTPRPIADLPTFVETTNTCRCSQSGFLVRRAPKKLHEYTGTPDSELKRFVDLMCADTSQLLSETPNLSTLYRASKQSRFPKYPHDLLFGDFNECMAALTAWLYGRGPAPMQGASLLIRHIIETFRSSILVGLLSPSSLIEWVIVAGQTAYARANSNPPYTIEVNPTTTKNTIGMVKDSGDLLRTIDNILFDEELVFWVTRNGRRSVEHFTGTCDLATEAAHTALRKAKERRLPISEQLKEDVHTGVRGWTWLAARLMYNHPESILEHITKKMRDDLAEYEDRADDVYYRLLDIGFGSQWNHRCYAPECLNTYMTARRRFRFCAGCKAAAYCSPGCQKVAWKHPTAPHRSLCAIMRQVKDVLQEYKSERSIYRVLQVDLNEDQATDACNNITALRAAKFAYLRTQLDSLTFDVEDPWPREGNRFRNA